MPTQTIPGVDNVAVQKEALRQQIRQQKSSGNLQAQSGDVNSQKEALRQMVRQQKLGSQPQPQPPQEGLGSKIFNAVTSSEQAFGSTLGQSIAAPEIANQIQQGASQNADLTQAVLDKIKNKPDAVKHQILQHLQNIDNFGGAGQPDIAKILPATQLSPEQIYGQGLGVAADIASAGSFGNAAKGAVTGERLISAGEKIAQPLLQKVGETALQGVAIGTGMGAAQAMQENKGAGDVAMSALKSGAITGALGGAIPLAEAGISKGTEEVGKVLSNINPLGKNAPGRIVNSLIKPASKLFSYGKNPGQWVAEEGLTGKTLEELGANVVNRKSQIGQEIGAVLRQPEHASKVLNLTSALAPLDKEIEKAASIGDQAVYTRLNQAKQQLLNEFVVGKDGQLVPSVARDFSKMSPEQAKNIKGLIGDITKWEGTATDKPVNAALKGVYHNVDTAIDKAVPGIEKLNGRYSNAIAADVAIKNRANIAARGNLLGFNARTSGLGSAVLGVLTGHPIPALLSAASGVMLDSALASPEVKTKFAAWLASATPGEKLRLFQKIPNLKPALEKAGLYVAAKASSMGQ